LGGYKFQGRTADEARQMVVLASKMQRAGAAALLLEAVPDELARAAVEATEIPVIGCGAGPHCHGHVFVTPDALGLTQSPPRFAPKLADLAGPAVATFAEYVRQVGSGQYPAAGQGYEMPPEEKSKFLHTREAKSSRVLD
jgi:3-methyl-2-oxobutanoate hydroxymethyltransferase